MSARALAATVVAFVALVLSVAAPTRAWAQANQTPPELLSVDVVENLGAQVPQTALFKDTGGQMVELGSVFDGKRPVLLVFGYHTCPMLCSLVLDELVKGLKDVSWTVGEEFDVVSISIDPRDTPERAATKRDQIVAKYGRGPGAKGWRFLTGDERSIRSVTDVVGFKYRYDERQGQYAHPAAIYLLTPEGRIARYLYGLSFDSKDLRFGLLEASQGRSVTTVERILMFCYHYDPQGKKYAIASMNVMRAGGALTVAALGGLLAVLWRRERAKKNPHS